MPVNKTIESVSAPAITITDVTPSDITELISRAVWVGVGGDLAVVPLGQTASVVITNVPGGVLLPLRVTKILSTGTSASYIQVWN